MSRTNTRRRRWRRIATTLSVSALAIGALSTGASAGPGPNPAQTKANVVSGSQPPTVDCSWAMPDMNKGWTGAMSYSDADFASDDNWTKNPTPNPACAIPTDVNGTPTGFPTQADKARNMIQVRPNILNDPTPRRIELWSAVSAPGGLSSISSVYWKVFHPDGSFKTQVHAETLTNGVPQPYQHGVYASPGTQLAPQFTKTGDCYGPGGAAPNSGDMLRGAASGVNPNPLLKRGTNQLSDGAASAANQNSLVAACNQQQKALFFSQFDLDKEQPCGEYVVEARAVVNGAEAPVLRYTIDVECVFDLETDFTVVDWKTLIPGMPKTLAGDTTFSPGDGRPTVRNGGNSGMQIGIQFAPLVQSDANGNPVPGAKLITWFDGMFGLDPNHLQSLPRVDSTTTPGVQGPPSWFDSLPPSGQPYNQILCSDEVGKLDLSVHPAADLPAGNYVGSMSVVAKRNPGDGLGNGQVWSPGDSLWPRGAADNDLVKTKLCWQDQDNIVPSFP